MATACRCGFPAAISVRMFSLTAFLDLDLINGMILFSVPVKTSHGSQGRGEHCTLGSDSVFFFVDIDL